MMHLLERIDDYDVGHQMWWQPDERTLLLANFLGHILANPVLLAQQGSNNWQNPQRAVILL
ncbi:MAG TPA: hypothetical protein V6D17_10090 [Candidatus Obscuribacterales bacterium]